ncbi:hypothetical protein CE91St62_39340 [Lachnospiraceae bacterium]|uniref:hypothetical protein n=1 Tax=Extibacter sp. GGCC_0201 TaxID=2731209 RepID=UPI001AA1B8A2|nr:hypothetical protein [Extibacter sp. GGCC_0201]MBO1720703.1 hypothetical protein [Extibacter sp. GGCC_0201]BDF39873.1 hypothetical protein CE91St62_39340 [Lachnospiraceae bacterium]
MFEIKYNGILYKAGQPIIGTPKSDYHGLHGVILEIRDGSEKETDNPTPDIYCCFAPPHSPAEIRDLERRFSELYQISKSIEDIPLDLVIVAPDEIRLL